MEQAGGYRFPVMFWTEYMGKKSLRMRFELEAWKMNLLWWMHLGYRPVMDQHGGIHQINMQQSRDLGKRNISEYIDSLAAVFNNDYLMFWQRSWFKKVKPKFIAELRKFANVA